MKNLLFITYLWWQSLWVPPLDDDFDIVLKFKAISPQSIKAKEPGGENNQKSLVLSPEAFVDWSFVATACESLDSSMETILADFNPIKLFIEELKASSQLYAMLIYFCRSCFQKKFLSFAIDTAILLDLFLIERNIPHLRNKFTLKRK